MKTTSKILAVALFAMGSLAFIAVPARGQGQVYYPQTIACPTLAAGVITNLYATTNAPLIDVRKCQNVSIWINSGTATNGSYTFGRSTDAIHWQTNQYTLGGGAGQSDEWTNIPVYGFGYLRLETAKNGDGTIIATNTGNYGLIVGPK